MNERDKKAAEKTMGEMWASGEISELQAKSNDSLDAGMIDFYYNRAKSKNEQKY